MVTRDDICSAVAEAAKLYPVHAVYLFGSYADGTATEKSDIDFYVQFSESPVSFFKVVGLRARLERMLEKDVDIVKRPPEGEEAEGMVLIYEA